MNTPGQKTDESQKLEFRPSEHGREQVSRVQAIRLQTEKTVDRPLSFVPYRITNKRILQQYEIKSLTSPAYWGIFSPVIE